MDVAALRRDFPILDQEDPPVYLDSACMTLKPRSVIEAVTRYYVETPFCAGRAVYAGSLAVETLMEEARTRLARFLGAKPSGVVFTKNTTEAINLVAHSYPWKRGDVVLTTDREHNSNLVPWQQLAARGVRHAVVPSLPDGRIDLAAFADRLGRGDITLVAAVHVSNLDGYQTPARELVKLAHDAGARVLLDGSQAAPHMPVDLARLGVDYYAVSAHKMLGPTGVGALVATEDALSVLAPFVTGGDTVVRTTYVSAEFMEGAGRFEAGLQNYAGLAGLTPAIDYLERLGMDAVHAHEQALSRRMVKGLEDVRGIALMGAPVEERAGIVPFGLDLPGPGMDAHAMAILLEDKHRIMVRSGDHCVHSWFNARELPGSVRASTYLYNTMQEADAFVDAVTGLVAALRR